MCVGVCHVGPLCPSMCVCGGGGGDTPSVLPELARKERTQEIASVLPDL